MLVVLNGEGARSALAAEVELNELLMLYTAPDTVSAALVCADM